MHPIGVASAAWVFASAPSKVPFYVAGGLLVAWAIAMAAIGLSHPGFPGSERRARGVMATSALLVAATLVAAVATASTPSTAPAERGATSTAGAPTAPPSTLQLAADPTGRLAYDTSQATVAAGPVQIRFTNASPLPHNVTIATGSRTVAATPTIQGTSATATASLPAGTYVFFCSVDAHRQAGMHGTLTVR